MPLSIGQIINNRYRIDALLGQGGMGAVYKVWDLNLEKAAALKENLDASPEAQKQFGREARLMASLEHPNLPRVTDFFFIPGQGQYLVMDFVHGEDMQRLLDQAHRSNASGGPGGLPQAQVVHWILQIIDALEYLHTQNPPIIHRDIKPANIRIRSDGRAMLVDFGIAKTYDPGLATTMGAKAITPGFSPPEQYGGGSTDSRSDIYALGATLYTLLTGRTLPESVTRISTSTPTALPRQINPQISPQVEYATLRAIQVDMELRFQQVGELRQALQAQAAGPAFVATQSAAQSAPPYAAPATQIIPEPAWSGRPPTGPQPAGAIPATQAIPGQAWSGSPYGDSQRTGPAPAALARRSPLVWALPLAVVLLGFLAGGIFLGSRLLGAATRGAAPTVTQSALAAAALNTPPPATPPQPTFTSAAPAHSTPAPASAAAATPTRSAAQAGPGDQLESRIAFASDRNGNYEIFTMRPDGSDVRRLTITTVDEFEPSWSPDGKQMIYTSEQSNGAEIFIMNRDGSDQRQLTRNSDVDRGPAFSPDGSQIAYFTNRDGNYEIYVMSTYSSMARRLTDDTGTEQYPVWSPDGKKIAFVAWQDKNSNTYLMNADGSQVQRLTSGERNTLPAWASFPDVGEAVIFWTRKDEQWYLSAYRLDLKKVETLSPALFPSKSDQFLSLPAFSSDYQNLIFSMPFGDKNHLFAVHFTTYAELVEALQAKKWVQLTDGTSNEYDPTWWSR